jgi:uncharacterized RDD family membrane protein YckC
MAIKEGFVYVGFWKRVLAAIIDFLVCIPFFPLTFFLSKYAYANRTVVFDVLYSVVWTVLWMWIIVRFGGTPGKLAIGARVVNDEAKYLNWAQAFRRMLFPSIILSVNSLCMTYATVHGYPDEAVISTFMEQGRLINEYGRVFGIINPFLGLLVYVDILVILTNREKRAVHDFIAGSYVITKEAYTQIDTAEQQVCQEYGLNPR